MLNRMLQIYIKFSSSAWAMAYREHQNKNALICRFIKTRKFDTANIKCFTILFLPFPSIMILVKNIGYPKNLEEILGVNIVSSPGKVNLR